MSTDIVSSLMSSIMLISALFYEYELFCTPIYSINGCNADLKRQLDKVENQKAVSIEAPTNQFFTDSPGISMWVFKSQESTSAVASAERGVEGRAGPVVRVFSSVHSPEKKKSCCVKWALSRLGCLCVVSQSPRTRVNC